LSRKAIFDLGHDKAVPGETTCDHIRIAQHVSAR
jgi:hypothetical protein